MQLRDAFSLVFSCRTADRRVVARSVRTAPSPYGKYSRFIPCLPDTATGTLVLRLPARCPTATRVVCDRAGSVRRGDCDEWFWVVASALSVCSVLNAQVNKRNPKGIVNDAIGAALRGAGIGATNFGTGAVRSELTNNSGLPLFVAWRSGSQRACDPADSHSATTALGLTAFAPLEWTRVGKFGVSHMQIETYAGPTSR